MKLPPEILGIGGALDAAGFECYLVGGCVRDLVLGTEPKDWDMASNATPQQILAIFEHAHYDNEYGTVRVVNDDTDDARLEVVEITTYRKDIGYSDGRRPDNVEFSKNLSDDLSRRDFTINALAYPITASSAAVFDQTAIVDEHDGLTDLEHKLIRTVGNPSDRFGEDALRLMRAIRFAAQLDFAIESGTMTAIGNNSPKLANIAIERIADEFNKLVMTKNPGFGMELLRRTDLLEQCIPELLEGVGITQNQAHSFTVWEHLIRTLQAAADKNHTLELRLAALFHDIAKPATREVSRENADPTFYNHEVVGARMTKNILNRLKYPKKVVSRVTMFVRWHMFFSDPDTITLAAVRRLISRVGAENIWDLVNLRICDRIGTGRPKEQPYRLRKFKAMIEEASRQPTSVQMLKINGDIMISQLHMKPGRLIGHILHILLAEVLEDPTKNNLDYQLQRASELIGANPEIVQSLFVAATQNIDHVETEKIKAIRDRHHVQ